VYAKYSSSPPEIAPTNRSVRRATAGRNTRRGNQGCRIKIPAVTTNVFAIGPSTKHQIARSRFP